MATVYLLYYLLYSAYIKHNKKLIRGISCQSPERMTVNHDVTGSSPVGGATKEAHSFSMSLNYLYIKFISGRSDNCFIGKEKIWSSKI